MAVHHHREFVLERRGSLSLHVVRTLTKDLMRNLAPDPDHFFDLPGCEIIKDQKKIKVARVKIETPWRRENGLSQTLQCLFLALSIRIPFSVLRCSKIT